MRRTPWSRWFALGALGALATSGFAAETLVILQPGYPGSTADASGFVNRLCEKLSSDAGPEFVGGEYHNEVAPGLEALVKKRPAIGIVSLGVYLKLRETHDLRALLWSQPDEPFRVVIRKGTLKSLAELAGRRMTGTPLLEPEFVDRVLFGGHYGDGAPNPHEPPWEARPVKQFSRGIRNVRRARDDAVILNSRQFLGAQRLPSFDELEVLHTTGSYPAAVVVAIENRLSATKAQALVQAFGKLPRDDGGRELLAEMGIGTFGQIDAHRLEQLEIRYRKLGERRASPAAGGERATPDGS